MRRRLKPSKGVDSMNLWLRDDLRSVCWWLAVDVNDLINAYIMLCTVYVTTKQLWTTLMNVGHSSIRLTLANLNSKTRLCLSILPTAKSITLFCKHNYETIPTSWTAPSIAVLTTSSGIASRYVKHHPAPFLPPQIHAMQSESLAPCSGGLTRGYRTTTIVTTTVTITTVLAAVVVATDPTTPEMASERCVRARSPTMPASPRSKSTMLRFAAVGQPLDRLIEPSLLLRILPSITQTLLGRRSHAHGIVCVSASLATRCGRPRLGSADRIATLGEGINSNLNHAG
jgi:hypothetical protein